MKRSKFIAIRNQADSSTLELFFLDLIQDSFDFWTGMESSKVQEIIDKVNFFQPRVIKLIIDSEGGDAQTGMTIYNYLKRVDARVETEVIGLAGSIASVIAMAANPGKLKIARNGFMMIHRAEGIAIGTAEELRAAGDMVDKYDDQIADIYSQRTGKPVDEVRALYANGDFWMTGQEAVDQGFADATFNDVSLNLNIAARLDLTVYKNLPDSVRAQLSNNPGQPDDDRSFLQTQLDDMKKFFTNVINAIKGVKPVDGQTVTNQIAEAITQPFETIADEIDSHIGTRVVAEIASEPVRNAISAQVTGLVDFSKDGAPKTAVETAVTNQLTALVNSTEDNALKTFVTGLINAAIKPLQTKNGQLEQEITNLKGKEGKLGEQGGGTEYQPKGNFSAKKPAA